MKKYPSDMTSEILEHCLNKQTQVTELADKLNYARPAVSKRLTELKDHDLIQKTGDKKTSPLHTTNKGEKFLEACITNQRIVEKLTGEEK